MRESFQGADDEDDEDDDDEDDRDWRALDDDEDLDDEAGSDEDPAPDADPRRRGRRAAGPRLTGGYQKAARSSVPSASSSSTLRV